MSSSFNSFICHLCSTQTNVSSIFSHSPNRGFSRSCRAPEYELNYNGHMRHKPVRVESYCWVTVHKATRVHTSLDRYREPFKGTVRTPSVGSGRGYCPQTAHLESRRYGHFVRKPANPSSYRVENGGNLTSPTVIQRIATRCIYTRRGPFNWCCLQVPGVA